MCEKHWNFDQKMPRSEANRNGFKILFLKFSLEADMLCEKIENFSGDGLRQKWSCIRFENYK